MFGELAKLKEISGFLPFLVLFIPGFISINVWELLVPSQPRDFSKSLYEIFAYTAFNFVILSPFLIAMDYWHWWASPIMLAVCVVVVFLVGPIAWPIIWLQIRRARSVMHFVPSPIARPWDHIFEERKSYWMILHFKNNQKIGAAYGRNSAVSMYPEAQEIFLEELWEIDPATNRFLRKIDRNCGVWISSSELARIELYR